MQPGMSNQCIRQALPLRHSKAETCKKLRLARAFGVIESQKIIHNLASLDDGFARIWEIHRT